MKALVGILFFLSALILCTIFARPIYQAHIERDLGDKVSAILTEQGLDPAGVVISDHHLTGIGELPATDSAREELRSELDEVIGLYLGADTIPAAPRIFSPPNFKLAEQVDQSVILTGLIGSESEREFLVGLAATPVTEGGVARTVIDQLELTEDVAAIGPTEKISELTPVLLSFADQGSVTWSPSELTLGGILENKGQEATILAEASKFTTDTASPVSELKVQPYQDLDFGIERKTGSVVMTGLLPDAETRNHLLDVAERAAKGSRVIDRTTLALRPRQSWWDKNPDDFLPSFLSRTKGPATVHYYHDRFVAKGIFEERSDYDMIKAEIDRLPEGKKRETNFGIIKKQLPASMKVKPNPAAAAALVAKLKDQAVYFGSSSAILTKKEDEKIGVAAELILATKNVKQGLTVGGYADLRGNADFNKSLSLKRANAVRDRLIKKGVPAERLTVNHFGEDTSKTSRKHLWKSRRVEISLTKVSDQ